MKLDEKNKKILNQVQSNGKITNNDLSEQVGIPATTIFERIKRLEKETIITGYKAILDPKKIEFGLTAFVFIKTTGVNFSDELEESIKKIPYVLELHGVSGDYSYLAKVCAKDNQHLSKILKNYFGKTKGISNTNSQIVLDTIFQNGDYPILKD